MEGEKQQNMNLLSNLLKNYSYLLNKLHNCDETKLKRNVKDSRVVSYLGENHNIFVILKGMKAWARSWASSRKQSFAYAYDSLSQQRLKDSFLAFIIIFPFYFSSKGLKMTSHHCVRQAVIIKSFASQEEFLLSSPHKTFAYICTECPHDRESSHTLIVLIYSVRRIQFQRLKCYHTNGIKTE